MKKVFKIIIVFGLTFIFLASILAVSLCCIMHFMRTNAESKMYFNRGIDIIPNADYIVVPGAKIYHSLPSLILEHRLDFACKLYNAKKAPKIIISGDFDENVGRYEVEVMYEYLINSGVKKEDILSDTKGTNTYATLKRVKEYVGDKSVIFCTQELYGYRALYIAKHLNLDMVVLCSDGYIYSSIIKDVIREHLSQVKAILNCTLIIPNVVSIEDLPFLK